MSSNNHALSYFDADEMAINLNNHALSYFAAEEMAINLNMLGPFMKNWISSNM